MLKRLLLAIMIALPSMVFAQKFGVINSQAIIENMPEMKDVQTQLQTAANKYEDEFKSLQSEFQKKFTELQSMEESTPQSIKDRRIQEMQELEQKIQQFRQTAEQDLQQQQQRLVAPIQEKVMTAVNAVGQEGGFTMIFENMVPVYTGSDAVDVTSMVKAKLGLQ